MEDESSRIPKVPILHHYTGASGAYGIISSNSLWATATQFSNDVSEIEYAAALAMTLIENMWGKKKKCSSSEKWLAEHLISLFQTPLHSFGQPFIVSFCEDGDLLSQWRAYGNSSGFSLAFSPLRKRSTMKLNSEHGFRTMMKRVIYDAKQQLNRLRLHFARLVQLVKEFDAGSRSGPSQKDRVEISLILVWTMTDWACSVKHPSFSEEREWRIITYPREATLRGSQPNNYEGVLVRPTRRLLLPYMVLEPAAGKQLPIAEARCGPSQFQEQSARAMEILLQRKGYSDVLVTQSTVPLRV
jgi:hypothetical protein